MAEALRPLHQVTIVCANGAADIDTVPAETYFRHLPDDDLLIYHYAVAWDLGDQIYNAFTGRRILRYHNVTPPHLIRPYSRAVARICEAGRKRLQRLAVPNLLLADSHENASDYVALTGHHPATEVLPPFSQTDLLLSSPAEPALADQLQGLNRPRLLFVGRISPHKNVHTLISEVDAAFADRAGPSPWFERLFRGGQSRNIADGPTLLIAGAFSEAFPSYNRLVRRTAARCSRVQVRFFHSTTVAELATLYRNSDLFVTASLHEGFCVPVVEALAFNLPMALPDSPVFHETSLNRARFFTRLSREVLDINSASAGYTSALYRKHYSFERLQSRLQQIVAVSQ